MNTEAPSPGIITLAREGLAIAWLHWRRLALAATVPVILAILAFMLLPSKYTATASVLVKNGPEYLAKEEGQVNGQAAPQVTKQEIVNSEIELMNNPETIAQTITALGGVARVYPSLVDDTLTPKKQMDAAIDKFSRKLVVAAVKVSNVIDLSFTYPDPQLASRALQALLNVYQRRHSEVYGGGQSSLVFQHDLATELADLTRLQTQLTQLKMSNGIYDIDQQRQSLIAQRSQTEDQLRQSEQQHDTLMGRVGYLTSLQHGMPVMQLSTETDKVDGVGALTGSLVELRQTESEQLSRYGADHPLVVQTRNQIGAVQSAIDSAKKDFTHVKTDPNPLAQQVTQELVLDRTELAPLDGTIAKLKSDLGTFTSELQRLEGADMEQRLLTSRISSIDENLKYLRTEYAKARASDDLDQQQALSVGVMQAPMTPDKATFPNPLMFAVAAIGLALVAAGGRFVLLLLSNDKLLTFQALEGVMGVRVLAVLADETDRNRLTSSREAGRRGARRATAWGNGVQGIAARLTRKAVSP